MGMESFFLVLTTQYHRANQKIAFRPPDENVIFFLISCRNGAGVSWMTVKPSMVSLTLRDLPCLQIYYGSGVECFL